MKKGKTKNLPDQSVLEVACKLMQAIDTPVSLSVYLLLKHKEWGQVCEKRINPNQYLDTISGAKAFDRDYQAVSYLRKYPGFDLGRDLVREAEESFYAAERQCKLTNMRLSVLEHPIGIAHETLEFLHRLRKIVLEILGPCPTSLDGKFGPGTVFEFGSKHRGWHRTTSGKLNSAIYCTQAAEAVVRHTTDGTWWSRSLLLGSPSNTALRIVPGNRFVTVEKNAVTRRGICVESSGNVFTQLGAGRTIRRRLKHVAGLDLKHGQALHQQMARKGSIDGESVTIDVRQASDTVAYMAIKIALAYASDWFSLLDCLRSPKTRVKGQWVWLEKFSSMGNGFTFELETLLFYALALAASNRKIGDPNVKVYGDDIIVPRENAGEVLAALKMFGFTPNESKTFLSGPFRESCGGDYFMGYWVTPVYLKSEPLEPSDWFTIANGLYNKGSYCMSACFRARRAIPSNLRYYGPRELGDVCLTERDPKRWTHRWREQRRFIRCLVPKPKRYSVYSYPPRVTLASALYGVPSTGVSAPREIAGWRSRWLVFS